MLDKMVFNILNDATMQLRSFGREKDNDKFGMSFEDLLNAGKQNKIDDTKPVKAAENAEKIQTVNPESKIKTSDNVEKDNIGENDGINKNGKNNPGVKAKEVNKSKEIAVEKKNDSKAHVFQMSDKTEPQKTSKNKKNEEVKIEVDNPNNIKLILLSLDAGARLKIESIIYDYNAGRLDKMKANSLIAQIINAGHSNDVRTAQTVKKKVTENTSENIGRIDNNPRGAKKGNEIKIENNNNALKSENKLTDNMENVKKHSLEDSKKEGAKHDIAEIKSDNDVKQLKTELNLNINELKSGNNGSARSQLNNSQRILDQNRDMIFSDIAKNTKIVLGRGETRFSTMIRPENLGRIDFKFMVKDGKMSGKLITHNEETLNFFKNNIEDLRAVMQKSNVDLSSLEMVLAGNNFNMGGSGEGRKNDFDDNMEEMKISGNFRVRDKKIYEDNNMLSNEGYSSTGKDKKINLVI